MGHIQFLRLAGLGGIFCLALCACETPLLHDIPEPSPPNDDGCTATISDLSAEVSATDITLTWSTNATSDYHFKVERRVEGSAMGELTDSISGDETSYSYTASDCVDPDKKCTFRVSITECGHSSNQQIEVYSLSNAPANLWTRAESTTVISIFWDPLTNIYAKDIMVEGRLCDSEDNYQSLTEPLAADAEWYVHDTMAYPISADDCWDYRISVRNLDEALASSQINGWSKPNAPGTIASTSANANEIEITWTDTNDWSAGFGQNGHFEIEQKAQGESEFALIADNISASTFLYSATSLLGGTLYEFRVYAANPGARSDPATTSASTPQAPSLAWNDFAYLSLESGDCILSFDGEAVCDPDSEVYCKTASGAVECAEPGTVDAMLTGISATIPDQDIPRTCDVEWTVTDDLDGSASISQMLWMQYDEEITVIGPNAPSLTLGQDTMTGRQAWIGNDPQITPSDPNNCAGCGGQRASIAVSNQCSCVKTDDSRVACWGYQNCVADGVGQDRYHPTLVCDLGTADNCAEYLDDVVAITGGEEHFCALLETGELKCWGEGYNGQLGTGNQNLENGPQFVCETGSGPDCTKLGNVVSVAAGGFHTCAVLNDGTAKCWGENTYGQLGDGTQQERVNPVTVCASSSGAGCPALDNVLSITAGRMLTCALMNTGHVRCWGTGYPGNAGGNAQYLLAQSVVCTTADCLEILSDVVEIAAGGGYVGSNTEEDHVCALNTSKEVWCWGGSGARLYAEQVCQDDDCINRPVHAFSIATSSGAESICGVVDAGMDLLSRMCWTSSGQWNVTYSGLVDPSQAMTGATAIGRNHRCAVVSQGRVYCSGSNAAGQLGSGGTETITGNVPVCEIGSQTQFSDTCDVNAPAGSRCCTDNGHFREAAIRQCGALNYHKEPMGAPR